MRAYPFLSQLLVDEFDVAPDEVAPEATPAGLGLDSMSTIELVRELEDEFGIQITTEQANFSTLGEAAAIADRLIDAKGG